MEDIGTASSILTFVDVAQRLLLACYRLREQWKDYERDISEIISEVQRLSDICEELREIVKEANGQKALSQLPQPLTTTSQKGGSALTACHSALEACTAVLGELHDKLAPLIRARFRGKLRWPFESGNISKKVQFIQNQKSTLELALLAYQTRLLTTHSRKTDDHYLRDKREKLLRWFKTSDPEQNHLASRESHEPGTSSWIFENDVFKRWANGTGGLLWLHGIPGAGKTILCSTIIHYLQTPSSSQPRRSHPIPDHVLYYYFIFSDDTKQSLANLLNKNQGSNEPSVEELIETLAAVVSACAGKVYLLVDALDECPKMERKAFYDKALGPILAAKINIMISSRKEPDIEEALRDRSLYEICIQNDDVNADVRAHVNSVIARDPKFQVMKPSFQEEILDSVVSGARGMFRWAVCQLEVIRQCLTPAMVRETLKTMPPDLDQTYDRILRLIPAPHRPYIQSALRWLAFSVRPLLLEELAEAAVVQPGEPFDPESCRLMSPNMIVHLCGVLVNLSTIHNSPPYWFTRKRDHEGRARPQKVFVTLSHYSVKEYLTSKSLQHGALSSFYTSVALCNSYIAQCCLTYILNFNGGTFARAPNLDKNPLLEYACLYWMTHRKNARTDDEDPLLRSLVRSLIERISQIDAPETHTKWLNYFNIGLHKTREPPKPVGLHPETLYWATSLGHIPLVKALIDWGADVNKAGGYYGSVLGAAAFHGHVEIVDFLLQRGANLSLYAPEVGSVLHIAVLGGNYRVVECLIERGADIDARDKFDRTPLEAAIIIQHHAIVDLLISRGASVRTPPFDGRGPLYYAARTGDLSLVNRLLDSGADVNHVGRFIQETPLYGAVLSMSVTLVRALIQKGAVLGSVILKRLLQEAIDMEHMILEESIRKHKTEIFHSLLDAGADNSKLETKFEGLLATALLSGEFNMARILMERGIVEYDAPAVVAATQIYKSEPHFLEVLLQDHSTDINVQALDSKGIFSSPLHTAIREEDEKAIWAILQENPDVNVIGGNGFPDAHSGWTPLSLAISHRLFDIAKELIRRGAAVNRAASWSPFEMAWKVPFKTPMQYAAMEGNLKMIQFLLNLGADINGRTGEQCSTLICGLRSNSRMIVEFLLDSGAIPDDMSYPNTLHVAITTGFQDLIPRLLSHGADVNPDYGEESPLAAAFRTKDGSLIAILRQLEHRTIKVIKELFHSKLSPNDEDFWGDVISTAVDMGNLEAVKLLIEVGATISKEKHQQLLNGICENGEIQMATFLLDKSNDLEPSEALILAAGSVGNYKTVNMLFARGAVVSGACFEEAVRAGTDMITRLLDVSMTASQRSEYLGRALQSAAFGGRLSICNWLIDDCGANINYCGDPQGTPLRAAIEAHSRYTYAGVIIEMLVSRGANVNPAPMDKGPESSSLVAAYFNPSMMENILDIGADINAVGGKFGTALHAAAHRHDFDAVRLLLSRGADVHIIAGEYGSALHSVAYGDNKKPTSPRAITQIMDLLLEAGADVNIQCGDIDGSAVQAAAAGRNLDALKWLVAHGADIRARGGKWGNVYRAALGGYGRGDRHVEYVPWHIISWLEYHYGRDGWEEDTED
ncbi:hypothetical protein GQX73_g3780 [Xylaria multiplex]|uniref:Uncharacterized protein n=1 Tax=Xylaria multiplex TaxID=323545 RepID=A0A7C8N012_9PEZI|nr:hypothetical protein GQX73_g3780 [Xylaria multiplex]